MHTASSTDMCTHRCSHVDTRTHVCTHRHMHMCSQRHRDTCTHAHLLLHIDTPVCRSLTHMHTQEQAQTHAHTHMCTRRQGRAQTSMHARAHAPMHPDTPVCTRPGTRGLTRTLPPGGSGAPALSADALHTVLGTMQMSGGGWPTLWHPGVPRPPARPGSGVGGVRGRSRGARGRGPNNPAPRARTCGSIAGIMCHNLAADSDSRG